MVLSQNAPEGSEEYLYSTSVSCITAEYVTIVTAWAFRLSLPLAPLWFFLLLLLLEPEDKRRMFLRNVSLSPTLQPRTVYYS
jgi:hypothetical protein